MENFIVIMIRRFIAEIRVKKMLKISRNITAMGVKLQKYFSLFFFVVGNSV